MPAAACAVGAHAVLCFDKGSPPVTGWGSFYETAPKGVMAVPGGLTMVAHDEAQPQKPSEVEETKEQSAEEPREAPPEEQAGKAVVQDQGEEAPGPDEQTASGDEAGESPGALKARLAEAEAAKEALLREKDELFDRWLRLQAEFDNFRKRTRREIEEIRTRAAEDLVLQLLPVIDNLERAIASAEQGPGGGIAEGVKMIHKQFLSVLEGVGVTPIEAVGQPFDPNFHEAVAYEESHDYPDGIVMEEMLRGYAINGKVLRASMVKVARGSGQQGGDQSDE